MSSARIEKKRIHKSEVKLLHICHTRPKHGMTCSGCIPDTPGTVSVQEKFVVLLCVGIIQFAVHGKTHQQVSLFSISV